MSEQSQGTWLTQEAYDRLAAELEHRKTTERKEIAQRVEAARQEGDLRENAGYHAAREEAGLNEARIIQLEETLENGGRPAPAHPDDWARVSGRRGTPVVSMSVLQRSREE